MQQEWQHGDYLISTDKAKLDIDMIHGFLTTAYWSIDIPRATVERALEHSLSFGVYRGAQQVGLARVISDYATFAYIADVFVLEPFRGQGLSKWLMEVVADHPDLQGLRRWILATRDAHELYQKTDFAPLHMPDRFMEKFDVDIYTR